LQAQQALQQQKRELKKSKKARAKLEQLAATQAVDDSLTAKESSSSGTVNLSIQGKTT
jgi:hypothetical protein